MVLMLSRSRVVGADFTRHLTTSPHRIEGEPEEEHIENPSIALHLSIDKGNTMMTSLLPIFFFAIATRQFLRARAIILDEDIDAVKVIFDHFATVAKDLRDEIELVYKERCDYGTLSDCDRNNYNDCSSEFPNPQCFDEENFNLTSSECECGSECLRQYYVPISSFDLMLLLIPQLTLNYKRTTDSKLGYYDNESHLS